MVAKTIEPAVAGLDGPAIEEFKGRVRGSVIVPGNPAYEDARRVRNGLIDRRPALVVRCGGVADVVEAVNFAREWVLLLSVRGGGHNVSGAATNDGGIVIDLSGMRGVRVDPAARTVRVQGGATWADVDRETQLFGLATPGGVVSSTGVGGLTLHGGLGHLRRKHGLSIDNLISVDIVTADGQVRTASETENSDLFWAIRGAGSNFGVVTSLEFRLHPVGPLVWLTAPFYALADGPQALRVWRDFVETAPDEVSSLAVLWGIPPDEHIPAELHGTPVVILAAVYAGPVEEGERLLQPLREIAEPVIDFTGPMPYTALQQGFDPFFPEGYLYYWKSLNLNRLDDEAIDAILGYANDRPSPLMELAIWHQGGAIGRVPAEATAFGRRDLPYLLSFDSTWTDPAETERNVAWTRAAWQEMQRFSDGGLYLNFAGFGEEKGALVRAAYGANYERLVQVKNRYDLMNLFRMNQNVAPTV